MIEKDGAKDFEGDFWFHNGMETMMAEVLSERILDFLFFV